MHFTGMSSRDAQTLWSGGRDSHNAIAERAISDGCGNPCRHCLEMIKKDEPFLVFSHRPFEAKHAYAEQGPIFLHASPCLAYASSHGHLPPVLKDSPQFLMRGYSGDERIVYGTGSVVERCDIIDRARALFDNRAVGFIDIRSAQNNCWQARIMKNDDSSVG